MVDIAERSVSSMVIAYLREQFCLLQRDGPMELEPESALWPKNDIKNRLPRGSIA